MDDQSIEQIQEQNISNFKETITNLEYKNYLSSLLNQKTQLIQSQSNQINELKSSLERDVELIKQLDEAVPIEEKKIDDLQEQNNLLNDKFQFLQAELDEHKLKEEEIKKFSRDADQEFLKISNEKNEMILLIEQSKKQKKEVDNHIHALEMSCKLLANEIFQLKEANSSIASHKDIAISFQNQLQNENQNIASLMDEQKKMKEHIAQTEEQINELQNQNIEIESQIDKETKQQEEFENKKIMLDCQLKQHETLFNTYEKLKSNLEEKDKVLNEVKNENIRIEKERDNAEKIANLNQDQIYKLKRSINHIDTKIVEQKKLIEEAKSNYAKSKIDSAQFAVKVEESINEIDKLKAKKKKVKKRLKQIDNLTFKLQNKIESAEYIAKRLKKERDLMMNQNLNYSRENFSNDYNRYYNYSYDSGIENTKKSIGIMRKQLENIYDNQRVFRDIDIDHKLLEKRMNNFENLRKHYCND